MERATPQLDVRAVHVNDASALYALDCSFETDRIYTVNIRNCLLPQDTQAYAENTPAFSFELIETPVDPPIYKDYREFEPTFADLEAKLRTTEGGYVALADGQVAGGILLNVEEWRSVVRIEDVIVGHQYRRYGVGSLLLSCAADWARKRDCWAIVLETQNINYPAIQFYLRNNMEIWSISQHFYPPGPLEHEVAILMGRHLT